MCPRLTHVRSIADACLFHGFTCSDPCISVDPFYLLYAQNFVKFLDRKIDLVFWRRTSACMSFALTFAFQFSASKEFIEARRRALKRFLVLVVRHPIMCNDPIVTYFMTFKGSVRLLHGEYLNCSALITQPIGNQLHSFFSLWFHGSFDVIKVLFLSKRGDVNVDRKVCSFNQTTPWHFSHPQNRRQRLSY